MNGGVKYVFLLGLYRKVWLVVLGAMGSIESLVLCGGCWWAGASILWWFSGSFLGAEKVLLPPGPGTGVLWFFSGHVGGWSSGFFPQLNTSCNVRSTPLLKAVVPLSGC